MCPWTNTTENICEPSSSSVAFPRIYQWSDYSQANDSHWMDRNHGVYAHTETYIDLWWYMYTYTTYRFIALIISIYHDCIVWVTVHSGSMDGTSHRCSHQGSTLRPGVKEYQSCGNANKTSPIWGYSIIQPVKMVILGMDCYWVHHITKDFWLVVYLPIWKIY
jgi:hypothetical protein